ncbi:MAG: lysophospholipid acyltransferase family protein [Candidatus Paceibacterota bacterium]
MSQRKQTRTRSRLATSLQFGVVGVPLYIVCAVLYGVLRLTGRIRIKHPERWPRGQGGYIIASNHPSLWEPIILMLLFPFEVMRHPIRRIPWSTPDKGNYDRWYWSLPRSRFIFVPRGKPKGELEALGKIIRVLHAGGRVIMFAEGGRTHNGKVFRCSAGGSKRVRALRQGLARAACGSGALVVHVWVDGAHRVLPAGCIVPRLWRRMTITIGEPYQVSRISSKDPERRERIVVQTEQHTQQLLKTAEE